MTECPRCDGDGWYSTGPEHDCGGDEIACRIRCPIEGREECPGCEGTGRVEERQRD